MSSCVTNGVAFILLLNAALSEYVKVSLAHFDQAVLQLFVPMQVDRVDLKTINVSLTTETPWITGLQRPSDTTACD